MARYRRYDPDKIKMIPVSDSAQRLPGTFEHALSYPYFVAGALRGVGNRSDHRVRTDQTSAGGTAPL
jgi:hypothetical protein